MPDPVTIALWVCLAAAPDRCEVRQLQYEGSLHECMSLGWTRLAAPWLADRPWLELKRATCETGEGA